MEKTNGVNHLLEGFQLEKTYQLAVKFLREKEGRAFHLSYADKNHLTALAKIVRFGPYDPKFVPDMGLLNLVGHDRIVKWKQLGNMCREDAQNNFIDMMDKACPLFCVVVEAHICKDSSDLSQNKSRSTNSSTSEHLDASGSLPHATSSTMVTQHYDLSRQSELMHEQLEQLRLEQLADQQRLQNQEKEIRSALKQQTYEQFRQYAEQQIPNDKLKQDELIEQLHEQHYQQYMTQIYQQQLNYQLYLQQCQEQSPDLGSECNTASQQVSAVPSPQSPTTKEDQTSLRSEQGPAVVEASDITTLYPMHSPKLPNDVIQVDNPNKPADIWDGIVLHSVASACMWSRKDVAAFKQALKDDPEGLIQVGSGEVVTVRVPTHHEGSCLFWEFATDVYDIGFGLFFEYNKQITTEEDAKPNENSAINGTGGGGEQSLLPSDAANGHDSSKSAEKEVGSPTATAQEIEIIPVFRRDCHLEVYCGSHPYPCQGVYLLRFDNSYSLWRSKTLYYRVYYSK